MVKPELDATKDYYQVLGVTGSASQGDIRKAFLDLARTQHPDKNPGHELIFKAKFQLITTAYDVLKDATLKATYDQVRPIARRPVQTTYSTNRGSFGNNKTRSSTTSETTSRSSAVPRQAKASPRTSPRKPPTARKDTFNDWTPPIPRQAQNKAQSTKSAPQAKYSQSKTRSTPSTTQSAFYNASPSSPLRKKPNASATDAASDAKATASKPSQGGERTPDWTLKDHWWAQSGTAYSTFHVPASKYSPYKKDSDLKTDSTLPGQGSPQYNASAHARQKSSGEGQDVPKASNVPQETVYRWKTSGTAYQQKTTNPKVSPQKPNRKVPIFDDIRAGNPFFDYRSKTTAVDPDRIDNLSDDSDGERIKPMKKSGIFSSASTESDSSSEPEKLESEESSGEQTASARYKPTFPVVPDRKIAKPRPFEPLRRPIVEYDDDSENDCTTTDGRSKEKLPNISPRNDAGTPFSFKLEKTPQTHSASSQRHVSNVPPYVKFNAVPDLNFSSPGEKPAFAEENLTFTPPLQTHPRSNASARQASTSASKKHPRVDGRDDPRYSGHSDHYDYEAATPDSLADRFQRTSLGARKSSLHKSKDLKPNLNPNDLKFDFKLDGLPNLPRYPMDAAGMQAQHTGMGTDHEATKQNQLLPPVVPVILLVPFRSLGTSALARKQYLTQCSIFNAYNQEWLEYEKALLDKCNEASAALPNEYYDALVRYHQILRAHGDTCASHAEAVAMQRFDQYPSN